MDMLVPGSLIGNIFQAVHLQPYVIPNLLQLITPSNINIKSIKLIIGHKLNDLLNSLEFEHIFTILINMWHSEHM